MIMVLVPGDVSDVLVVSLEEVVAGGSKSTGYLVPQWI